MIERDFFFRMNNELPGTLLGLELSLKSVFDDERSSSSRSSGFRSEGGSSVGTTVNAGRGGSMTAGRGRGAHGGSGRGGRNRTNSESTVRCATSKFSEKFNLTVTEIY